MNHITPSNEILPSRPSFRSYPNSLNLAGLLGIAADDLDFFCMKLLATITLEPDILDKEGPDIVTESVGFQVALHLKLVHSSAVGIQCRQP